MALDGTLENLIGQYIQLMTTYTYNNVDEMKNATNLVNGSFARTSGFYEFNDGGGAVYKIREHTNVDVIDNIHLFALDNTANLIAELIYSDSINIKQLGAYDNDNTKTSENTTIIQYALNNYKEVIIPIGTFYTNSLIIPNQTKLIGINQKDSILIYNGDENGTFIETATGIGESNYDMNIKDICIRGENVGGIGIYVITSYVKIINCYFYDFTIDCIKVETCNNIIIEKNFIQHGVHSGINAQYSSLGHGQINAVYITNNNIVSSGVGIIFAGNNVIISGNTIQNNNYAIKVGEATWNESYNQNTTGSVIKDNYTELTGNLENTVNPIITIYSGYVSNRTYNRIVRDLIIENNYFAETNANNDNIIVDVVTDANSYPSSRATLVKIINNYSNTHTPIRLNSNEALSYKSEVYNNSIYDDQIDLPTYVCRNTFNELSPNNIHYNNYLSAEYINSGYFAANSTTQDTYLIYPKNSSSVSAVATKLMQTYLKALACGNKNFGVTANFEYEISKNGNAVGGYDGKYSSKILSGQESNVALVSPFTHVSNHPNFEGATEGYQITIQPNRTITTTYNIMLFIKSHYELIRYFNIVKLNVTRQQGTTLPATANYEGEVFYKTNETKWYVYENNAWRVVSTN